MDFHHIICIVAAPSVLLLVFPLFIKQKQLPYGCLLSPLNKKAPHWGCFASTNRNAKSLFRCDGGTLLSTVKTVPRTVFPSILFVRFALTESGVVSRPSFSIHQTKKHPTGGAFLFGGEGSLPSVSHTHFQKDPSVTRNYSIIEFLLEDCQPLESSYRNQF